jgi:hypothetical protein
MKKGFFIFAITVLLTESLFSKDNTLFISGDIGFNLSSSKYNQVFLKDNDYLMININPNIGYYITNGLIGGIGIQICYSNSNSPNFLVTKTKSTQIYFSPFVRYYFESGLFGQIQLNIGGYHVEINNNDKYLISTFPRESNGDISTSGLGLGIGYAFKAGDKFKIEPFLKYNYLKESYDKSDLVTKTGGLTFNVGFSYSL